MELIWQKHKLTFLMYNDFIIKIHNNSLSKPLRKFNKIHFMAIYIKKKIYNYLVNIGENIPLHWSTQVSEATTKRLSVSSWTFSLHLVLPPLSASPTAPTHQRETPALLWSIPRPAETSGSLSLLLSPQSCWLVPLTQVLSQRVCKWVTLGFPDSSISCESVIQAPWAPGRSQVLPTHLQGSQGNWLTTAIPQAPTWLKVAHSHPFYSFINCGLFGSWIKEPKVI